MINQKVHKTLETANLTDVIDLAETLRQRCENILKAEIRAETDPRMKQDLDSTIFDVNGLFDRIESELNYWA